jgi:hypothetical protein
MQTKKGGKIIMQKNKRAIEVRLWSKINIKSKSECWEWIAGKDSYGYGQITINSIKILSHRLVWKLSFGDIPEGMCVLHKCDNPACCNPSHLFLGTHQDNMKDRDRKNRQYNRCGESNGRAKLTTEQVILIRNTVFARGTAIRLARQYGVSSTAIYYARDNQTWKHV